MRKFRETCFACKTTYTNASSMKFLLVTGNWICKPCFGNVTDGYLYWLHGVPNYKMENK